MLGAGSSSRFEMPVKKQWLRVGSDPLWLFAAKNLSSHYAFKEIIVASNEEKYMSKFAPSYRFVKGGATRQESLKNALKLVQSEYVLVSDIARPMISAELFSRIIGGIQNTDCVVPALKVPDTVYLGSGAVDREQIKLIQTPQLSRTAMLKSALESGQIYTDDKFKGADSAMLLKEAYRLVQSVGFELINADVTVIAERPKLSKFKSAMEINIANALNLTPSRINVKATTTERLGFTGRGEGIAATASASLKIYDWTQK